MRALSQLSFELMPASVMLLGHVLPGYKHDRSRNKAWLGLASSLEPTTGSAGCCECSKNALAAAITEANQSTAFTVAFPQQRLGLLMHESPNCNLSKTEQTSWKLDIQSVHKQGDEHQHALPCPAPLSPAVTCNRSGL